MGDSDTTLSDGFPVYGRLTGWDYLALVAALCSVPFTLARARLAETASDLGLDDDVPGRPTATYSTRMKRKPLLVAAAVHRPRFLLLDEPTSGLDPDLTLGPRG